MPIEYVVIAREVEVVSSVIPIFSTSVSKAIGRTAFTLAIHCRCKDGVGEMCVCFVGYKKTVIGGKEQLLHGAN
jgi:hypothetical protein